MQKINMQKIKSIIPIAILVLLTSIIVFGAVMFTLELRETTVRSVENKQNITQIVDFINKVNQPK